jgi:hypothetical protein
MRNAQIKTNGTHDPAALAQSLRDLARDAHRVVHTPRADAAQVRALSQRIAVLREQTRGFAGDMLATWLDRLGRRLEVPGRVSNDPTTPRGRYD